MSEARELGKLSVCFMAGTLGQGGAERQLYYILRALAGAGTQLRLLCLNRNEYWEQPIRDLGVPVIWIGRRRSRLSRLARVIAELRRHRPDVVQSQHFYTNLYVAGAARTLGVRDVGAIRNDAVSEVHDNGRMLGRLSLRVPRMIAVNSGAGRRNAIALGVPGPRLLHLPNVVDTGQFKRQLKAHPRAENGIIKVLVIGRLTQQKRIDRFLSVLRSVRARARADVRGIVVGSGPLRADLELRAAELGLLFPAVEFREPVYDVAALYHEADILVLSSDWEGTPNVLLEAMASGLPVVATRVGDVPEIVRQGETGFLVDRSDEMGMVEALVDLVEQPERRALYGHRGREYVEAHHASHRLPDFLAPLYTTVLR